MIFLFIFVIASAYDVIEDEGDEGDDDISMTTLTISEQPPILVCVQQLQVSAFLPSFPALLMP